jgi:hypothetical protein
MPKLGMYVLRLVMLLLLRHGSRTDSAIRYRLFSFHAESKHSAIADSSKCADHTIYLSLRHHDALFKLYGYRFLYNYE